MEPNEASTLVARAAALLKEYEKAVEEHEVWEINNVQEAIKLLEKALEKLV